MNSFIIKIPLSNVINYRDIQLEGYQVRLWFAFNLTLNRWILDIENKTLETKSLSIVMNQGTDLLNSSGRLDLQSMVLINSTQIPGLEADEINIGNEIILMYMDLDTYQQFILKGAIGGRRVYRVSDNV